MWITSSLSTAKAPTLVALGNFDGVHRGHQQVICPILGNCNQFQEHLPDGLDPSVAGLSSLPLLQGFSDRTATPSAPTPSADIQGAVSHWHGPVPTVVTFFPHPQEFFSGVPRSLLTPLDEKALQLSRLGVEQLVLMPFNTELANLSPEMFVEQLLIQQLRAQHISVGVDFRFGKNRAGTVADLKVIAARYGVKVTEVPLQQFEGGRISSSRIRQALEVGDLAQAQRLLGRPYSLTGQVVKGQQLGRTLGFPTANLKVLPEKFLPRRGVYSVQVYGINGSAAIPHPGVMNLGTRPTVDGLKQTLEVYLLGWSGDLYGQTLTVALERFLRPEQRFDSLADLKRQIQADCQAARQSLTVQPCM